MPTTSPRPVVAFDPLDQAWRFEDRPLYQQIREAGSGCRLTSSST